MLRIGRTLRPSVELRPSQLGNPAAVERYLADQWQVSLSSMLARSLSPRGRTTDRWAPYEERALSTLVYRTPAGPAFGALWSGVNVISGFVGRHRNRAREAQRRALGIASGLIEQQNAKVRQIEALQAFYAPQQRSASGRWM